jgi:GNAT superfamily N-acetyltransferase
MVIRAATDDDWSAIWRFMRPIVAAGETFSWDRDLEKAEARAIWCHKPPGRTIVAVDDDGIILGTAETEPNHGGPESHVATASFMVDPDHQGRGVGRALASTCSRPPKRMAIGRCSSMPLPRRMRPRQRSGARSDSRCLRRCPRHSITRSRATSDCTSCTAASEPLEVGVRASGVSQTFENPQKKDSSCRPVMELAGLEPATSWVRSSLRVSLAFTALRTTWAEHRFQVSASLNVTGFHAWGASNVRH